MFKRSQKEMEISCMWNKSRCFGFLFSPVVIFAARFAWMNISGVDRLEFFQKSSLILLEKSPEVFEDETNVKTFYFTCFSH